MTFKNDVILFQSLPNMAICCEVGARMSRLKLIYSLGHISERKVI